jgi:Cu(I)/Ag(I) efflux system membrane fusion protein
VASGQFLIDSEASLRGALQRLGGAAPPAPTAPMPATVATHRATGKVEQIAKDEVTISHGPVPSLKWPSMTMGFQAPPGGLPKDIKVGDAVQFEIQAAGGGAYKIVSISRSAATTPGSAK